MRSRVAIHHCSFSDGFFTEPHWLGRERVSARADVGASGKPGAAANAFAVFAGDSCHFAICF